MDELIDLRKKTQQGIVNAPITQAIMNYQLDTGLYARYLLNVWHYATHSAKVIGLAGSRAVNSHPALAEYLFHHAQEEMGHDEWAMKDLQRLGWSKEAVAKTYPTPNCAAMIGYEYYLAGIANPVSIFGWLYILEAMGDDLGKKIAENLSKIAALENSVKFLAGHGVADEAHTKDLTEMIRCHIRDADYIEVVHVAEVIERLYVGMFEELSRYVQD